MPQPGHNRVLCFRSFLAVTALALCLQPSGAAAQDEQPVPSLKGHITSLSLPDSFSLNGKTVAINHSTTYEFVNDNGKKQADASPAALQVGADVAVVGVRAHGILTASSVYVLDETTQKISGFGLIDKVLSTSPDLIFRADGYRIRLTPATTTSFSGGLKNLADVNTNVWVKYEGKFDNNGNLIATALSFYPGKTGTKSNVTPVGQEEVLPEKNLLDTEGAFHSAHTKFRVDQLNGNCGWHWALVDEQLQHRVARIGASLVPAYQKQLPEDDRASIPFRFYVVRQPDFRFDFGCSAGLILIPEEVASRLKTNDELAAVLADGVASYLELQSARVVAEVWGIWGVQSAANVAGAFSGWALIPEASADLAQAVLAKHLMDQRSRMALALMSDAGYDPWAAPEAWRLLAPKKLRGNTNTLKYPSRSNYQLTILHEEYRKDAQAAARNASAQSSGQH